MLYKNTSESVELYVEEGEHIHISKPKDLPKDATDRIKSLYSSGLTKPSLILAQLRKEGINSKKRAQLSNFLKNFKDKTIGKTTVSLGELENWCKDHSLVPDDVDEAYVIGYRIHVDEADNSKNEFHFVLSTKRLLDMTKQTKHVMSDATHKLNYEGFPVLVAGVVDQDRKFHPSGFSVSAFERDHDYAFIFSSIKSQILKLFETEYAPNTLIADCAQAITNGFEQVFGPEFTRIYDWAHVNRNIRDDLKYIDDKSQKEEVMADISKLQVSKTKEIFEAGCDLFLKKWHAYEDEGIDKFLSNFESEYLNQRCGWYEALAPFLPSTSNSIESTNRVIKDDFTFRERWPLGRFLGKSLEVVGKWSDDRNPDNINVKSFSIVPH